MTKTIRFLIVILILFICKSHYIQANHTVIWYLPHPDDETIGMADSIYQSVTQGNKNYFIYFTKGENSWARHDLKGPDGTIYQLTKTEFGEARVKETMAALKVLGVRPEQVLFLDYPDGGIPQQPVEEVIRLFATLYPGSIHRTVSGSDAHEDHQTLARALAKVSMEEDFHILPEYYHVYIYREDIDREHLAKRPVEHLDIKAQAFAEFSRWEPENGRYAIAATSTPDLLEAALISRYEYMDAPHVTAKPHFTLTPGVIFSTSELGLSLQVGEKFSAYGLLDYNNSAPAVEVTWRLSDDVPFAQLIIGIGYHIEQKQPYTSTIVQAGNNYYFKIRHILQGSTSFSIGINSNLIKR